MIAIKAVAGAILLALVLGACWMFLLYVEAVVTS